MVSNSPGAGFIFPVLGSMTPGFPFLLISIRKNKDNPLIIAKPAKIQADGEDHIIN